MTPLIGIDPGTDGYAAVMDDEGIHLFGFKKQAQWADFKLYLRWRLSLDEVKCHQEYPALVMLEHIWARPASGDRKNFQSGQGKMMLEVGRIQGILEAFGIDFQLKSAVAWQKIVGVEHPPECDYPCRKRIHCEKAKDIWQDHMNPRKITQKNADALLILHALRLQQSV